MVDIHPTAIVDRKAQLADSVKVGPYCVVGPQVSIEAVSYTHLTLPTNREV